MLTDDSVCVTVFHIAPSDAVEIKVFGASLCSINHREEYIETVSKYHIGNEQKRKCLQKRLKAMYCLNARKDSESLLKSLNAVCKFVLRKYYYVYPPSFAYRIFAA